MLVMIEWNQLLIRHRLGKDIPEDPKTSRTCFQRDYDRLVFSSPLRRLKDKTQVLSLAKNFIPRSLALAVAAFEQAYRFRGAFRLGRRCYLLGS